MSDAYEFVDTVPTPNDAIAQRRRMDWAQVVVGLKQHRLEWLRVRDVAVGMATYIKQGRNQQIQPKEHFEVKVRDIVDGKRGDLYIRYVGPVIH